MAQVATRPLKNITIRMLLMGCTNRPFYHLVVQERFTDPFMDFSTLEQVGTYDPMPNLANEKLVALNFDRIKYWLGAGARPNESVGKLLGLCGFYPVHPMSYIIAKRNRIKAASKEKLENTIDANAAADEPPPSQGGN